eukprot:7123996-Pyramimonas_sp.AAC.1
MPVLAARVGIFSRRTNQTQEVWVYSHGGPIGLVGPYSQAEDKTRGTEERFAHPKFESLEAALKHAPEQSNFYVRHMLGKKVGGVKQINK